MRLAFAAALCAVLAPALALAQEDFDEEAAATAAKPVVDEDAQRTLADRIPAVTRRYFQKEGRIELAPAVGLSLNDPFFRHLTAGGGLAFHILESLAIGASGEVFVSWKTPVEVKPVSPVKPDYNRPTYAARLDIIWSPLYGKLSLLAESVLHFDTYIAISGGVVGSQKAPTPMGSVALGQHYVFTEWMAVKLELRDQIFPLARNPEVNKATTMQNLLTATLGLCFYLPAEVERSSL
jgi:outer membrane beta-barrel protein